MDFTQTITITIMTAGFALAGSIFTLLINLFKGMSDNKHQIKMERIRIHDADRFKAYSNAYSILDTFTSDPSEARWDEDISNIRNRIRNDINPYIAYYPPKLRGIFIEVYETLGNWLIVQSNPDLSMDLDIDKYLNNKKEILKKEAIRIMNEWEL